METESDDASDTEDVISSLEESSNKTTLLMSFEDGQESVQSISAFLIKKGHFNVAHQFSILGDKINENACQRRSTQSRLERYFHKDKEIASVIKSECSDSCLI